MNELLFSSGELLETAKKMVIYTDKSKWHGLLSLVHRVNNDLNEVYRSAGVSRAEAIECNIKKLSKRYRGLVYSDAAAQERVDKESQHGN